MNSLFQTVTNSSNDDNPEIVSIEQSRLIEQKIMIKDLVIDMPIGVLPEEKLKTQRVIVNLELDVTPNEDTTSDWIEDNINNVVSYADVIEMVQALAIKQGHIHLVETFAEMIIQKCFENALIQGASVSVEKPDIIAEVSSVGVKISRKK